MTEDEMHQYRGIYAQIASAQQDIMFILADRRLSPTRKRELVRRLQHICEQIERED